VFTSGTTGQDKAALFDFDALVNPYRKARPGYRTQVFLLLDHLGGIHTMLHSLAHGGTLVLSEERKPAAVARAWLSSRVRSERRLLSRRGRAPPAYLRKNLKRKVAPERACKPGPVSRGIPGETVISLGRRLPGASSGHTREHHAGRASPGLADRIALLLGLAPSGVYRAGAVTRVAGELLPHRFTLTDLAAGGLLSVALVRGVAPPGR